MSNKYPPLTPEAKSALITLVGTDVWAHLEGLERLDTEWVRNASPQEASSDLMQAERGLVRGWSIARDQGLFLYNLVRTLAPARILELGASLGYSTSWLASAARCVSASIITVENDKTKLPILAQTASQFADVVTVAEAEIKDILSDCQGSFDLIFLDADPFEYGSLTKHIWGALDTNAMLVIDNAISPVSLAGAVQALGAALNFSDKWTVPIGHGMLVGRRR